jgi:signal peptidase II
MGGRLDWRKSLIVKKLLRNYWMLVLVAGVIILADQVSKAYIRANFVEGVDMWAPWPWLLPYARILYVSNTGVAFGMFKGMGMVFSVLAIIVSIAIVYYFPRVPLEDWTLRLAMSLQLAGAMGNLIDRLTIGHVTDFISVGNFAVFNVADASITVGVGVLLLGIWMQEQRQKRELAAVEPAAEPAVAPAADASSQDKQANQG